MPSIPAKPARQFTLPGITFTALVSPSVGSRETSVWQIEIAPGTPGAKHQLTREEIIVVLSGKAMAMLNGEAVEITQGSAVAVPPDTDFSLTNPFEEAFRAMAMIPAGAEARMADGAAFAPPWFL
jgi:quercetin dioxygenase-like cupin family protein